MYIYNFKKNFCHGNPVHSGSGSPHYRAFMITSRHTTIGRIPLDKLPVQTESSTWQHTTLKKDRHPCLNFAAT